MLDKMIYTEHPLFKKLKDSSVYEYIPNWTKNNVKNNTKKKQIKEDDHTEKISFDTF